MKKFCAVILSIAVLISIFPVTASADNRSYIKITADKETASPGDEITFTITMGGANAVIATTIPISIPEGLIYVAGSGQVLNGVANAIGYEGEAAWTEASLLFSSYSTRVYTNSGELQLATFRCKVDAGAEGLKTVSISDVNFRIYYTDNVLNDTESYTRIGAAVTIGAAQESYIYNGRDYSPVFDGDYYLSKYADLREAFGNNRQAAFLHFLNHGMAEGRQGSANFDVHFYRSYYPDLERAFGGNLVSYYIHYIDYGRAELRKTVEGGEGSSAVAPDDSNYSDDGFDAGRYELVFNAYYYFDKYADLQDAYGTEKAKAFKHFLETGMSEGRQASENFNVQYYKANYPDLQEAFGDDLVLYYEHYINHGYKENRKAAE